VAQKLKYRSNGCKKLAHCVMYVMDAHRWLATREWCAIVPWRVDVWPRRRVREWRDLVHVGGDAVACAASSGE